MKKLKRSRKNRVVGGVCAGLADYFNIDVVLVRAILLASVLFCGVGLGLYLILWIIAPE
jgi:phage shock protein PspC (stress-responsive transcriptional regulator)